MKRWLAHLVIAGYLTALGIGLVCHTFGFGLGAHPAMYYVVWDMFCGWSAYESRMQVIGEGESGTFYELSPGPWGDFKPYGPLGRRHYDTFAAHGTRMALNALAHTRHEPITTIYVIEENHAKKYNLPDDTYERMYGEPMDMKKYYHVRCAMTPEGQMLAQQQNWLGYQYGMCVVNNPRLQADMRRNKPFYLLGTGGTPQAASSSASEEGSEPGREASIDSPLGN